jgi:site-specific recombinase XerD
MNVQQAIASFLEHSETKRNLSQRTLRAYQSDLVQFTSQVGATEPASITEGDLEQYVSHLGAEPYRETSIRRKVAAIKVFFRYLEEEGFLQQSPARRLRIKQPAEIRVPNVLSMKEIKSLLSAPKRQIVELSAKRDESAGGRNRYFCAVRDNLIIELLLSTGVRIGELVALDLGDVDLEAWMLRITGRGTRGRSIQVASEVVREALADYLVLRQGRNVESEALFIGRSGTRLTIYSIENIFKKYVLSSEIKRHVTPHALRHTMASMLINGGADIRTVQEILGHASILSTQVYTKLPPARGRRTAELNQRDRIVVGTGPGRLPIRKK